MKLGVRYVVILNATTHESEKVWKDWGAQRNVGAFGRESTRYSDVTADVLDVKYLRKSGSVTAWSSGECGWGMFCCIGLPPCVIPFCLFARTEAEACSALGEGVMKFLIDGHDTVPTTELGTGIDSEVRTPDTQTAPQPASEEDLLKRPQEPGQHDKDSQN
jgi:hypothetical protein